MKRKKFLALALAGVMTAATLTACAPLEDLYDWFFGGGSGSASRGNGVNLVELNDKDYNGLKKQIMDRLGLNDGDVTTPDRSRTVLEEVVGKLNAATMMDAATNGLNDTVKNDLNEVAKSQLQLNSGMCIDVMKLSPTSADATPAIPDDTRTLYWARYTNRGNGSIVGEGGEPGASSYETYESELGIYGSVRAMIGNRVPGSNVDFFAATFTKDGETYLGVVALWKPKW